MPQIGQDDIAAMLSAFERSCYARLVLSAGATRISASRASAAGQDDEATELVTAPRVGNFEASLAVGARVSVDTVIGSIMTRRKRIPVLARRTGLIAALLVTDEAFVEYGQPLVRVRTDGAKP